MFGAFVAKLPVVSLGSADRSAVGVDLSDVIEPLRNFWLSGKSEQNLFIYVESDACVKLLVEFGNTALRPLNECGFQ